MYSKTQYGKLVIIVTLIFTIVTLIFLEDFRQAGPAGEISSLAVLVFFAILTMLFYRLKVEVNKEAITLLFGIGIIKKRIDITEIESVETVTNRFLYGWGIRLTPHGWMWNIAGYNAVELNYKNSTKKFRIGCEDSDELKAAIESNMQ